MDATVREIQATVKALRDRAELLEGKALALDFGLASLAWDARDRRAEYRRRAMHLRDRAATLAMLGA